MKTALSVGLILATTLFGTSAGASDGVTIVPTQERFDRSRMMTPSAALVPTTAPTPAPAWRASSEGAQAASTTVTILQDSFESFPGSWAVSYGGPVAQWGSSTYRYHDGSHSAYCAGAGSQQAPAGGPYLPNMNTWMVYGPFSLSDAATASVSFWYWLNSESNHDYLKWFASTDHVNYYGYQMSGNSNGWATYTQDLADSNLGSLIGQPQVWFAFVFTSDSSTQYEGAYIDAVTISKTTGGTSGSAIQYWVPVVSHAPGALSSVWRSDVSVLNAGSVSANVTLKLYAGSSVYTGTATVAAGAQAIYPDLVNQLSSSYSGSGALEVDSDQPVFVTSRTYNQAASGTYGQDYNSFTAAQGYSAGQVFYLPQLTENAAYRTNIGVTNLGATSAAVTVDLYGATGGTPLNEFVVNLTPGQWYQDQQPFKNRAGQTNMTKGYAKLTVTSGTAVIAYASVIDNVTGDPTTIPMKLAAVGPTDYWLPATSHAPGALSSVWRSDLGVLNVGSATANVTLKLYAGSSVFTGTVAVAAGAQAIANDVVNQLSASYSGSGALEVVSDQPVFVTSRTYNQAASGTYGQDYNSFTTGLAYSTGQVIYLPQLTENSAYRTNIGVTNIGATSASVTVDLYGATGGTPLNEFTVNLTPGQWYQDQQPFKNRAGQTNMASGYAKLTVTSGSAVVAYASVIDNVTGDPTTIPMKRGIGSGVIDPLASATWIYTGVLGQLGVKVPTLDTIVSSVVSSGPGPLTSQLIAPDPVHRIPLSNGVRFDYGAGTMVRSAWVTGSATVTYSNANNTSNGFSANYAISTSSDFAVNGAKYPITSITGTVSATQSTTSGGTALEEGVSRVFAGVSRLFGMVPSGTKTVADLTVNGTGSNPAATESGGVHFDTSVCRNYPVSGSIIRTIGSDRYVFNFTNKCDSSFGYAANPPALSCNAGQQVAGGDTPDSRFFEMGRTSATFRFDYDTQSIPDRIQILYQGAVIFDSTCLGTNGTITAHPSFSGSSSLIQVNVTPNCSGGTSGTAWSYQVYCP
jgi:hypothetical protein